MKKIELENFKNDLKPRARDWHKGLSGHVLIVGGSQGFLGAACMAGKAALRVGAGLVSLTVQEKTAALTAFCPELMCHRIKKIDDLMVLIEKADVIALGPGLGQTKWSKEVWEIAIHTQKKLIVDADGLNLLAQKPFANDHWILTPHPGEAARLLETTTDKIQQDRLSAICELQKKYGGIIVLKGAGSLVLGKAHEPLICEKGNPGMATAGMGDVLTGVIAGLLAQKIPATESSALGVLLHALAGDLAAKEGERGMIATDLMPHLRKLCNPG